MWTSFNVLDLSIQTNIYDNPFNLSEKDVYELACRVNPKRSFLFVSKLIGKHLAVIPDLPRVTGFLLAERMIRTVYEDKHYDTQVLQRFISEPNHNNSEIQKVFLNPYPLKEQVLFIGFAETATGLGHSVYSAFTGGSFIHTTRENLQEIPAFQFQEEHSHATDHACYFTDENMLQKASHIVLIDDEMTSGKTTINLIRALHARYPKKKYTVLSILDWRNEQERQAFDDLATELNADIYAVSLFSGSFKLLKDVQLSYNAPLLLGEPRNIPSTDLTMYARTERVYASGETISYPFLSGRFGINDSDQELIETESRSIGRSLKAMRQGKKTLVCSFGEFMYIPSRIASYMGEDVYVKTTTRSPIYPHGEDYPIYERFSFKDDDGVVNNMYNLSRENFDELFFIMEKPASHYVKSIIEQIAKENGISYVRFIQV